MTKVPSGKGRPDWSNVQVPVRAPIDILSAGGIIVLALSGCARESVPDSVFPTVPAPTMAQPVAAALNISPDPIRPGGEFIVAIGVRVAAGYHIQGASPDREPFLPTSIDLKLPDTCTALNEWEVPKPVLSSAGKAIYTDSVVFRRRCRVSSNAGAGIVSIQSTLRFQACSDEVCRPPAQLALATGFRISN